MSHTPEQQAVVLKVLSYRADQFYEILQVSKTADEAEIKKSYRKMAIKLHPDKNPHPRADEAFKMVNKAWGVLSDPQKKRIFDQTGSDPDTRFNPSMSSNSARTGGAAAQGFAQPGGDFEDIFDFFFNGGRQGGFGASGSTFTFGNNGGFTFQSFGGPGGGFNSFPSHSERQRQRARQQQQQRQGQSGEQGDVLNILKQLLPILIFVMITVLPQLFGGDNVPDYSFSPSAKFDSKRQTPNLKIPFFVNGAQITKKKYSPQQMNSFDSKVENLFVQDKRSKCSKEQMMKNELYEDAHGWFSVDQQKLKRAENYPMPNCQILRKYNLI